MTFITVILTIFLSLSIIVNIHQILTISKIRKGIIELLDHNYHLSSQLKKQEADHQQKIKKVRADTRKRSRAIIRGQATEQVAPLLLPDLPRKDFKFLGDPIDFIVFVGSSGIKDGTTDQIEKVVFLEIKTGNSSLNKTQVRIRNAIQEGKVVFATFNPDTQRYREW